MMTITLSHVPTHPKSQRIRATLNGITQDFKSFADVESWLKKDFADNKGASAAFEKMRQGASAAFEVPDMSMEEIAHRGFVFTL